MPKVSVIVPVYNVEKYLKQCIESILAQSLQDIEVICVNDGSTDRSLDILKSFAAMDRRVRIIDKENTGYGYSMNVGIESATGEYVGIVESDDFAHKDMFSKLYEKAVDYDADMIKSDFYNFYEGTANKSNNLVGLPEVVPDELQVRQSLYNAIPSIWSAIYKTSFLRDKNIRFNETPGASYQDTSFAFLTLAYAKKIILVQEAYLYYRRDNMDSSVTNLAKVNCIFDEFAFLEKKIKNDKSLPADTIYFMVNSKYLRYMWNYRRILDIDKKVFLYRMVQEFQEHRWLNEIPKEYWTEYQWNQLQYIMESPDKFVYEDRKIKPELYIKPLINEQIYVSAIFQQIMDSPEIIIYGAGTVGHRLFQKMKNEGYSGNVIFATSTGTEDIPSIEDLAQDKRQTLVVVAVLEEKQAPMIKLLRYLGYRNAIRLDKWLLEKL